MASIRTLHRSTTRFALALSGAAVAVLAMASGAQGATAASAPAGSAASHVASFSAGGVLDGFAQPLAPSTKHHHHPKKHHHGPYTPRQVAWHMLHHMHFSSRYQYPYLNKLWERESGWNVHAENPYTGAAGIPQATPGSKMATAGPNWPNNVHTQIRWGLRYIKARYGSPRQAWLHEAATGWY